MKLSSLSVKRRPVKKGALRKLFANIPRRKVRASTAAAPMSDAEGDVPNLGIARALVVILVIHVVAIAGIFAHSHWFEGPEQKAEAAAYAAKLEAVAPAKPLADAQASLPKIADGDGVHLVTTGDTYEKIAEKHGVSDKDLRAANDNMELRAGRILRIPPRTIVAVEPEELTRLREGSAVLEEPAADDLHNAPMVETVAAGAPVLVRPGVTRQTEAAATTPVRPAETAAARPPRATEVAAARPSATPVTVSSAEPKSAARKYTVKNGDTFWKIAQAHKTTPAAIMKANHISDPKKLKTGMELQVP